MTVKRINEGSGPPVLFVHGLGVSSLYWAPVVGHLPNISAYGVDLPGHGDSPMLPGETTLDSMTAWLAAAIEESGLGSTTVVGMSLGGLLAQALAAHYPFLVDGLVLVDTVAVYPEPVRQQWGDRALAARDGGMAQLVAPTLDVWFTAEALHEDTPEVQLVRSLVETTPPEGYARACELLVDADTTSLLSAIHTRTLVVCGEEDMPPFIAAVAQFEAQLSNASSRWIDDARHGASLERSAAFASLLREFLRTDKSVSA